MAWTLPPIRSKIPIWVIVVLAVLGLAAVAAAIALPLVLKKNSSANHDGMVTPTVTAPPSLSPFEPIPGKAVLLQKSPTENTDGLAKSHLRRVWQPTGTHNILFQASGQGSRTGYYLLEKANSGSDATVQCVPVPGPTAPALCSGVRYESDTQPVMAFTVNTTDTTSITSFTGSVNATGAFSVPPTGSTLTWVDASLLAQYRGTFGRWSGVNDPVAWVMDNDGIVHVFRATQRLTSASSGVTGNTRNNVSQLWCTQSLTDSVAILGYVDHQRNGAYVHTLSTSDSIITLSTETLLVPISNTQEVVSLALNDDATLGVVISNEGFSLVSRASGTTTFSVTQTLSWPDDAQGKVVSAGWEANSPDDTTWVVFGTEIINQNQPVILVVGVTGTSGTIQSGKVYSLTCGKFGGLLANGPIAVCRDDNDANLLVVAPSDQFDNQLFLTLKINEF